MSGDYEYFNANSLKKKCKKKNLLGIHDWFIRDEKFRKDMFDVGRFKELCHKTQIGERKPHAPNHFKRHSCVAKMSVRHRAEFKQALSTLRRRKHQEDTVHQQRWKSYPHLGGIDKNLDGIFLPSIITKTDPVLIDEETCGKVIWILVRGRILRIHLKYHYSSKIDNNQRNLLRPTGSVNTIPAIQQNPWKNTTTKTKATMNGMRTSVRRTTVSSQRTTETTRTTSSSQCITSVPMTTFTSTIAWCTSYVESSHRGYCSTLDDEIAHLMTQVLSNHIVISMVRSLWLDLSLLLLLILPVFLRLPPLFRAVRQTDRNEKFALLRRRWEWGHRELLLLSHKSCTPSQSAKHVRICVVSSHTFTTLKHKNKFVN